MPKTEIGFAVRATLFMILSSCSPPRTVASSPATEGQRQGPDCPADSLGQSDPAAATSCLALLRKDPTLASGAFRLDLDGSGPSPVRQYYCDMTAGGWTLVAHQVVDTPLSDSVCTLNAKGMGSLVQSYRLGGDEISNIHPAVGWKLTDNSNSVYFKPECVVDWRVNYFTPDPKPAVCTTGYRSIAFQPTEIVNGRWVNVSGRGIGVNNSGAFCSIRMYEAHFDTNGDPGAGAAPAGVALPCKYMEYTSQNVALWFQ
jgi:hypothetical protein